MDALLTHGERLMRLCVKRSRKEFVQDMSEYFNEKFINDILDNDDENIPEGLVIRVLWEYFQEIVNVEYNKDKQTVEIYLSFPLEPETKEVYE